MSITSVWTLIQTIFGWLFVICWVALWLAPIPLGLWKVITLFVNNHSKDKILACLCAVATALSAAGIVWLSVDHFQSYGYALFLGLPVYCGILPVVLFSRRTTRSYEDAIGITFLTLLLLGVAIIFFALDGLICILLASPLACFVAFIAAFITNLILRRRHQARNLVPALMACALLPFMVGFEARCDLPPPTSIVVSSVNIAASSDAVWKYLPAIPDIPGPPEPIFRSGVAYPLRSEMDGTGVGAKRLCVLSTGPLQEVITDWEPGRLLRFDVISCPPSMHELSIYHDLQTPHLENFMVSEWGQFRLIRLDATHTRLEGTSQYHNRMWPAEYWIPISDWIVHRIHYRVLNFIKTEAENDARN
ncbi:MAG: hypothetical protein LV479_05195 [Methylacidiphilales bacterium]|nr:hypothetical protein [Candidatus Methylacidiphilales bacterium]